MGRAREITYASDDRTIILSTENVQKFHSRPKLWGFEKGRGKIGKSVLTVTLFKQLPRAQIGSKFKNVCVHQEANDQTIILSLENAQKVHSRPKLWHSIPRRIFEGGLLIVFQ